MATTRWTHTTDYRDKHFTLTVVGSCETLSDAAAFEARILAAIAATTITPQPGGDTVGGAQRAGFAFTGKGTGTVTPAPSTEVQAGGPGTAQLSLVAEKTKMPYTAGVTGTPATPPQRVTVIAPFSHKRWTNDDDDMFIIEHYGTMKTKKIGAKLGRSEQAINARAGWLRSEGYPIPMLKPNVSAGIRALNERRKAEKAQPKPEPSPFDMTPTFPELMGTN